MRAITNEAIKAFYEFKRLNKANSADDYRRTFKSNCKHLETMHNLVNLYNQTDGQTRADGLKWYQTAHDFCAYLATKYQTDLPKVVGMFAALSPATNYEQNKRDTEGLLKLLLGKVKSYKCTTYGPNVEKAKAIFGTSLDVLSFFNEKTGPKTLNFYRNVLNPCDTEAVTIDRHAFRIATGLEYKAIGPKQYREIAAHYRKAAKKVGILPQQLQAVLWVDYRQKEAIRFTEYTPF